MRKSRVEELLRASVSHIQSFEEDMSNEVFQSLGFTEEEIYQILYNISDAELKNLKYVSGVETFKNGELIWILNDDGLKWIFSDWGEATERTTRVPFKNHSHYMFQHNDGLWEGFAWYAPTESYVNCFKVKYNCMNWLAGDGTADAR